jgi:predicted RNA-binding Zn ribbon-like protein
MIKVTWAWLGQAPALDLANTVAVVDGIEHDLIGSAAKYERWAGIEARFVPHGSLGLLQQARAKLLDLRITVRTILAAATAGEKPRGALATDLNRVSRRAPQWLVLDADGAFALREESSAQAIDLLLAHYARSAMEIVVGETGALQRCSAPSCGMFYASGRRDQWWCSTQCGTRARVARHYQGRRRTRAS